MLQSMNPLPDDIPAGEHDLASDPGVQSLASLAVPGELEEWGNPDESAEEDSVIIRDLIMLRGEAAELYL